MAVRWFDQFPAPLITTYQLQPFESVARTDMTSGVSKQRQRFTSVPVTVSVAFIFPSSLFGFFEAWYIHEARGGAEWFDIDLTNGAGINSNQARFNAPYVAKFLGSVNSWRVDASLEVRNLKVLSKEALTLSLGLGTSGDIERLLIAMDNFNTLIQSTIPLTKNWNLNFNITLLGELALNNLVNEEIPRDINWTDPLVLVFEENLEFENAVNTVIATQNNWSD